MAFPHIWQMGSFRETEKSIVAGSLYNTELNSWRSGSRAIHLKGQTKCFSAGNNWEICCFDGNRDLNKAFSSYLHSPPISSTINVASFRFPIALCAKFYQHLFQCAKNICFHAFFPWVDSVGLPFVILLAWLISLLCPFTLPHVFHVRAFQCRFIIAAVEVI